MEVCRLCLDLATESDMIKLEGTYMDATQIVLPEVNTSISSSPVICTQCTCSLDELYTFKASVMETEHQIKEKIGDDKCQLRLKEVITGVKIEEKDADLGKSKGRMCRACLYAIEAETFTVLKPTQSDAYLSSMLLMCLPEMDLELTLDPVMCEQCLCNLQKLYHFKSSCLDVEERLKSYCQQHGTSSSSQINLHLVLEEDAAESKSNTFAAVKSEPVVSSVSDYKSEEEEGDVLMSDNSKDIDYTVVNIKKEEQNLLKEEDDTGDDSMGDDAENITNEEIRELKQEELKIEDVDGAESKTVTSNYRTARGRRDQTDMPLALVKCNYCEFTTKTNKYLRSHIKQAHNRAELPLLKCDLCDYSSQIRKYLQQHFSRVHAVLPLLKCERCDYTAKDDISLKLHVQRNHNRAGLPLLKCDLCAYTSRFKNDLQRHFKRCHTDKVPLLKCDHCSYTSRVSSNLRKHVEIHRTEKPLLTCKHCGFTTKSNWSMKRHSKRCNSQNEVKLLECELCDYSTPFRDDIRIHFVRMHTDRPLLKCDHCKFTTKYKMYLKRHVIRHQNSML